MPLAAISHDFDACHGTLVPQFASRFGISTDQADDLFSSAVTKCLSRVDNDVLRNITIEAAKPYRSQGMSLLWSVAARQRIDDVRSINRRKTSTLEPREDGEVSEDQFGYIEEDPESHVLARELSEEIPGILDQAGVRPGHRQLLDALRSCAGELIPNASDSDFFCFAHAYLYDECRAYQLPDRDEISGRLCRIMDKKRNALHVQVHRFKPVWEEARAMVTAA